MCCCHVWWAGSVSGLLGGRVYRHWPCGACVVSYVDKGYASAGAYGKLQVEHHVCLEFGGGDMAMRG